MTNRRPAHLAQRAPLLGAAAAWGAGATAAHAWAERAGGWTWFFAGVALASLALAWATRARRGWSLAALALALAGAGALRTADLRARPAEWDALGLPPRETTLELKIERTFAAPPEGGRAGGLARVLDAGPLLPELRGQRVQFAVAWPEAMGGEASRGMVFRATGLLRAVAARPEAGSFDRFVADAGVNFSFTRATPVGEFSGPGAWGRFREAAGARLEKILRAGLDENEAAADLYVAMVLGQKDELDDARRERFLRSGTMHLFAISGLHVAGIALAVHALLALTRAPAWGRFAAGTAAVWLFVDVTGAAPSAVRAFWMVTAVLAAKQARLPGGAAAALAATCLAVLVVEPHHLFSAGFQMSYGIVLALLFYGVPLQEKWWAGWTPGAGLPAADWTWRTRLLDQGGRAMLSALALGVAAALVGTPAGVAFFGLLSPAGFFVNLALIPAAALVLFSAVGAMAAGLLGATPVAVLCNHAAALVLTAMEGAAEGSLGVPGAWVEARFAEPWLGAATLAGVIAMLAVGYARGWRAREGGLWLPWAALGLALVLGVRLV